MDTSPIRVAIVEDHQLYRDLLVGSLSGQDGIEVVGHASGSAEARRLITPGKVDVAILDIELADGNGVGLGLTLRRVDPNLGIVLLSARDVLELMLSIPEADRRGWSYLSKSSTTSLSVLINAIRQTAAGETVIDPGLTRRSKPRAGTPVSRLTKRQFEILRLVATGMSNQGIADQLKIASNSVVNHLSAIYQTLDIPEGQNARVSAVLEFLEDTARQPA